MIGHVGARGREHACQEASPASRETFIPCGRPAVAIVDNGDARPYWMCEMCASHNVANRGAVRWAPEERAVSLATLRPILVTGVELAPASFCLRESGTVAHRVEVDAPADAAIVGLVVMYTVPPDALHASFRAHATDPGLRDTLRGAALGALGVVARCPQTQRSGRLRCEHRLGHEGHHDFVPVGPGDHGRKI